jgi:hypothetical protein
MFEERLVVKQARACSALINSYHLLYMLLLCSTKYDAVGDKIAMNRSPQIG